MKSRDISDIFNDLSQRDKNEWPTFMAKEILDAENLVNIDKQIDLRKLTILNYIINLPIENYNDVEYFFYNQFEGMYPLDDPTYPVRPEQLYKYIQCLGNILNKQSPVPASFRETE